MLIKTLRHSINYLPVRPCSSTTGRDPHSDKNIGHKKHTDFVERAQLFDYWQRCADERIEEEFEHGKMLLMVDRQPAVQADAFSLNPALGIHQLRSAPRLKVFDCADLRQRLSPYGLEIGTLNSALLDILPIGGQNGDYQALFGTSIRLHPAPQESGISEEGRREELAKELGSRFMDIRHAMLTMDEPTQRNWLAKFQAVTHWYRLFLHCPKCQHLLQMRASKASAKCLYCDRDFYPTISPVAITLVRDESDEHALLVRHRGMAGQVFTCIAGFCSVGESLEQTVCREVAEEVGVECFDVRPLHGSQSWPLPSSSLMVPFIATAHMEDELDPSIAELEHAKWFSREMVVQALRRVDEDPFMLKLQKHLNTSGKDPVVRQTLRYIPPQGAIAYHIIRHWALRTMK